MRIFGAVLRGGRGLVWFVKGVMGEDAYLKYRAHAASVHGSSGEPVMTEREFWRDVTDRQEHNPHGRCC